MSQAVLRAFTVAVLSATLAAPAVDFPVTSAFSYQGRLNVSGVPATGSYDFEFQLWNDPTAGAQQGMTQTALAVAVAGGLFTTSVDFGAAALSGSRRWLQVLVRSSGVGGYTALGPRQQLTAAPFATYAVSSPLVLFLTLGGAAITSTSPAAITSAQPFTMPATGDVAIEFGGTFFIGHAGIANGMNLQIWVDGMSGGTAAQYHDNNGIGSTQISLMNVIKSTNLSAGVHTVTFAAWADSTAQTVSASDLWVKVTRL